MNVFFKKYIIPFFVTSIVFILTLLKTEAADQVDWAPKLYGHFFPIMQDGATSLSIQVDFWKFSLDFAIFYAVFLAIFFWLKPRITKVGTIILSMIFVLVTTFFTIVISTELSVTKISNRMDFSKVQSMWINL
ncbi:hypothetical protein [Empedobacter sedimenti]|uniref:hypothetical protein n=1 Tax=Empedobacter sedimenti TaxID=3042610 RepID=UPI0024A79828|nr:hypothetical protein [Empedobacter sedimenti]